MVSLNTLFTLGILGAGLLAFTSLGGAGGIGTKPGGYLGGGLRDFQQNISSSFNQALKGLNPFAAEAAPPREPIIDLQLSSDPSRYTDPATVERNLQNATDMNTGQPIGTSPQLPDPYTTKTDGGQVDTSPAPQATPIETTQEPEVRSGIPAVSTQGIVIPATTPTSYLERITQYVAQPLTVLAPQQATSIAISRAKSNYGGYDSPNQQNRALQNLLASNAQKYGEYFN